MPWTIAHAAAVLPLRKFCSRRLSFSGLVVGSFVPDAGNYVNRADLAEHGHTLGVSFSLNLLIGFSILVLLRLFHRPLGYLLPQPHRNAVLSQPSPLYPFSAETIVVALFSLAIGALTHLLWDSFTHLDGTAVSQLPILRYPLFSLAGHKLYVYSALQHLSSVAGSLIILICYWRYLRTKTVSILDLRTEELFRYVFFAVSALVSFALAIPMAYDEAKVAGWSLHSYLSVKCVVVYFTNAFITFFTCAAIAISFRFIQRGAQQH